MGHPERSEASASVFALAFMFVILSEAKDLLLFLPVPFGS